MHYKPNLKRIIGKIPYFTTFFCCISKECWLLVMLVMGDRLNFIIDHRLESVDAFDAILPIIISSHIFTELSTFYALEGNSGASGFFLCPRVKGNNNGLGIEFYLFVSHGGMNDRGSMCKFRNARSAFRNLHVDPLSFIPP